MLGSQEQLVATSALPRGRNEALPRDFAPKPKPSLGAAVICFKCPICGLCTTMSDPNPWILKAPGAASPPSPTCKLRLFCFPQAGSGAWMYHKFTEGLPPWVEVCASTSQALVISTRACQLPVLLQRLLTCQSFCCSYDLNPTGTLCLVLGRWSTHTILGLAPCR